MEIFKYLGVLLSRNLSWSDHISELCTKVRRILGLLYRQFYDNVDPATLKQLYISLVCPHLEYASQVWDPYLNGDIDRLEAVQKFALKLISRQWDLGYEELLSITDVPKLGERRLQLKLAQVFKNVHGLCYFPEDVFITQPSHSSRLARSDILLCPFARTNYYFHSSVPSSIRAWNSLSEDQVRMQISKSFALLFLMKSFNFCPLKATVQPLALASTQTLNFALPLQLPTTTLTQNLSPISWKQ